MSCGYRVYLVIHKEGGGGAAQDSLLHQSLVSAAHTNETGLAGWAASPLQPASGTGRFSLSPGAVPVAFGSLLGPQLDNRGQAAALTWPILTSEHRKH